MNAAKGRNKKDSNRLFKKECKCMKNLPSESGSGEKSAYQCGMENGAIFN